MNRRYPLDRLSLLAAACLLLMLSSTAWAAYPLTITHGQGTLVLDAPPERVAVFDVGILDILAALEVEVAGVAGGSLPAYLEEYGFRDYPRVGTLFEPDEAALASLNPDLIIVAGRASRVYEEFSAFAPTLDLDVDPGDFVAGVRRNLDLLGQIFGHSDRAAELDDELMETLAALRAAGAGAGTALTLFTVGDNVIVHGPGERFGMMHEITGMASVAPPPDPAMTGERPPAGSPEALALRERRDARLAAAMAQGPDWLFVLDRGAATGGDPVAMRLLPEDPHVAPSEAWRAGRVYHLDPPGWYIATGGYLELMRTAQDIRRALRGE